MRKRFLSLFACVLLFASCKENHALVSLTISPPSADSVYQGSVDAAQVHNILVEEFTGASCPNCPAGHAALAALKLQYGNTLHILGIHPHDTLFAQAFPQPGAQYDFRTKIGYALEINVFGGLNFMPSAGVDRVLYSGGLLLDRNLWGAAIGARSTDQSSPVNLTVSSSYNPATDTAATIAATIKYVSTVSPGQNLSIAIVEDSLVDAQDSVGISIPNYVFNNVFRDMVTSGNPTSGDPLLASHSSITAGTVNIRTYFYKVNQGAPNFNNNVHVPQHCRVIAFVTDNTTHAVLQSAECPLVN